MRCPANQLGQADPQGPARNRTERAQFELGLLEIIQDGLAALKYTRPGRSR